MGARTASRPVSRAIAAAVLTVAAPLAGTTETLGPPTSARTGVDVLGVRRAADQGVTFVASVRDGTGAPTTPTATVVAGGETLPARVTPLWSGPAAFGIVVDVSADGAAALQGGGLSGAAGFLLQLPAEARSGVIAARRPPAVVATPSVGAADDLRVLSALRSGGVRATSEALTLAAGRLPDRPGGTAVIALYTSAGDAGGESAAALADRLLRGNAVLAVVTTAADPRYWTEVAEATGGVAVATSPDRAVHAFDEVADALRTRFVVGIARPPTGIPEATLRWAGDGGPAVVSFTLPPEGTAAAGGVARSRRVAGALAGAAAGGVVVLAVVVVLVARRRRRRRRREGGEHEEEDEDELVPAVPDGVRVFAMESEAPREITGSLFEPRSVRDARERMAREREARAQGRTAEGAGLGD
jgi:hypothetical protein